MIYSVAEKILSIPRFFPLYILISAVLIAFFTLPTEQIIALGDGNRVLPFISHMTWLLYNSLTIAFMWSVLTVCISDLTRLKTACILIATILVFLCSSAYDFFGLAMLTNEAAAASVIFRQLSETYVGGIAAIAFVALTLSTVVALRRAAIRADLPPAPVRTFIAISLFGIGYVWLYPRIRKMKLAGQN